MTDAQPGPRSLTWWPIAGAALLAAVIVVAVLVAGPGSSNSPGTVRDAQGALVCPRTFPVRADGGVWVPTTPLGVDGTKSLVPDATPLHLTVCRFGSGGSARMSLPLTGSRRLTGALRPATHRLHAVPLVAKSGRYITFSDNGDAYLLGLVFHTGVLWVSVHSGDAGNGVVTAQPSEAGTVAALSAQAYAAGHWPS